jgi:hypothetical protein
VVPVAHPTTAAPQAGGAGQPGPAGGTPAASPSTATAPAAATPAPTLTLGRMPAKLAHPAGSAGGTTDMPPAKLAGTVLLSGGGLVALVILIRAMVNARRRRYEFAGL